MDTYPDRDNRYYTPYCDTWTWCNSQAYPPIYGENSFLNMIISGKSLADKILSNLAERIKTYKSKPHLVIVLVGENMASEVYVKNKLKACEKIGIQSTLLRLPEDIDQEALWEKIHELNSNKEVSWILVQSPLPPHIDAQTIFDAIDAKKDVDGFSSTNIASRVVWRPGLLPATPVWIISLLEQYYRENPEKGNIVGKHAVVIGKSLIVGNPLATLLLRWWATVTVCHSRTSNLYELTHRADILVVATGKKHLITRNMIKPGSIVVDVGINVEYLGAKKYILGDCDTTDIAEIADITSVPGGVGPMTIACLLQNVIYAYESQTLTN